MSSFCTLQAHQYIAKVPKLTMPVFNEGTRKRQATSSLEGAPHLMKKAALVTNVLGGPQLVINQCVRRKASLDAEVSLRLLLDADLPSGSDPAATSLLNKPVCVSSSTYPHPDDMTSPLDRDDENMASHGNGLSLDTFPHDKSSDQHRKESLSSTESPLSPLSSLDSDLDDCSSPKPSVPYHKLKDPVISLVDCKKRTKRAAKTMSFGIVDSSGYVKRMASLNARACVAALMRPEPKVSYRPRKPVIQSKSKTRKIDCASESCEEEVKAQTEETCLPPTARDRHSANQASELIRETSPPQGSKESSPLPSSQRPSPLPNCEESSPFPRSERLNPLPESNPLASFQESSPLPGSERSSSLPESVPLPSFKESSLLPKSSSLPTSKGSTPLPESMPLQRPKRSSPLPSSKQSSPLPSSIRSSPLRRSSPLPESIPLRRSSPALPSSKESNPLARSKRSSPLPRSKRSSPSSGPEGSSTARDLRSVRVHSAEEQKNGEEGEEEEEEEEEDKDAVPFNTIGLLYSGVTVHPNAQVFLSSEHELPQRIFPQVVPRSPRHFSEAIQLSNRQHKAKRKKPRALKVSSPTNVCR